MKKIYIIVCIALLGVLFTACNKDKQVDYSLLLQGTWVNTLVNDQSVLTDKTYIMELKSDGTEMYATGYSLDENNKTWKENSAYQYTIKGDIIHISGADIDGNKIQSKFKIQSLADDVLKITVEEFSSNGKLIPDNNTYTLIKVKSDHKEAFTGVWYGKCTTPGAVDSLYHYWEYFEDGSFNYYYQDKDNKWIKKSDNQGRYFLYGQLMVSNYSHDLLSGGQGLAFEGWNFSIKDNKMIWTGLRENNVTVTYEMEKVSALPKI
jgi:hypothetical protein